MVYNSKENNGKTYTEESAELMTYLQMKYCELLETQNSELGVQLSGGTLSWLSLIHI